MMPTTGEPFTTTDWSAIDPTHHPGTTGSAEWRTKHFGEMRMRMVSYSPDYVADHWCERGHILLVVDGQITTELRDGRIVVLTAGQSYEVSDDVMAHRTRTVDGARLFIVD